MAEKRLIYDLSSKELEETILKLDQPSYRSHQIWEGLYKDLYNSFDNFSTVPKEIRKHLEEKYSLSHLNPVARLSSKDNKTIKTMFRLPDGNAIEAVLMRYQKRRTLCISTQAGCAMGCVFCATGQMGFRRNLTQGEIVEQVIFYLRSLKVSEETVTNIVYMGMGEPFHNYDAVMESINILNHPKGLNIGARRITISTVGLIPGIKRFTQEDSQVNLAVSLHASDNSTRSELIPINNRYPIEELIDACKEYVIKTNRRITFEWALIEDENDTSDQANKLGSLLAGINCHINIIPLNPTQGYKRNKSNPEKIKTFSEILNSYNIPTSIRVRRGIEIQAGCGQLATQIEK